MNLAARLSDHAQDNEILMSRRTWGEVQNAATTKPTGALDLKGFSNPVEAYLLEGLRPA